MRHTRSFRGGDGKDDPAGVIYADLFAHFQEVKRGLAVLIAAMRKEGARSDAIAAEATAQAEMMSRGRAEAAVPAREGG